MDENIRILIVEDDPDLRQGLHEALDEFGFTTTAAANGRDALAQLRAAAEPPHAILLDLSMPVMDGPAFRAEQLRDPRLTSIPVILVTAQEDVAAVADELRVSSFLRKPVRLLPLLQALRHLGVQ